jgi:alpha-ketoglutarate-dependent taurine dioxygenase
VAVKVENIKPHVGARIHAKPEDLLDPAVVQQCLEALEDRAVLVFPQINLTNDQQLAFTDALGSRVNFTNSSATGDLDAKDVYTVTLDPKLNPDPEAVHGTYFWHMDGLISDIVQPKASLLSARVLSAKGGQTEFASTYAAYEALPEEDKAELEGLVAEHSLYGIYRHIVEAPSDDDMTRWTRRSSRKHLIVKTQPSGRKSLIIGMSADRVEGLSVYEGRALVARLNDWAAQPDFTYRHHWSVGDLVVWDNCGALHRVIPYAKDSGRKMHRTSVAGVAPNLQAAA